MSSLSLYYLITRLNVSLLTTKPRLSFLMESLKVYYPEIIGYLCLPDPICQAWIQLENS